MIAEPTPELGSYFCDEPSHPQNKKPAEAGMAQTIKTV
jgi:hypothetical protein